MDKHNYLFLDIETIPCQDDRFRSLLSENLKCPKNITRDETKKKWWRDKAPALLNEAYLKTALDGSFGEIISLAWAYNDSQVYGIVRKIQDKEADLLRYFYDALDDLNTDYLVFVGHNIMKFDLPFLRKRSIINKVHPPINIPSKRGPEIFDTMETWAGYNGFIKLDILCQVLSIKGKPDIDGTMIYSLAQSGRYKEILAYNKQDVTCTRACFNRMTFKDYKSAPVEKSQDNETELLETAGFFDD